VVRAAQSFDVAPVALPVPNNQQCLWLQQHAFQGVGCLGQQQVNIPRFCDCPVCLLLPVCSLFVPHPFLCLPPPPPRCLSPQL
jgi:hypothetical protein